jgi:hypothetical protein
VSAPQDSTSTLELVSVSGKVIFTVGSAPVVSYQELKTTHLQLCAASWSRIQNRQGWGDNLADLFEVYVTDGLQRLPEGEGALIETLLRSSTVKKSRRGGSAIDNIMRYCCGKLPNKEKDHVRKLQLLGRMHQRAGVTSSMVATFCDVLLTVLARCLYEDPNIWSILLAWSTNFKFVLVHMENIRVSFLTKPHVHHLACTRCGELIPGLESQDMCDDCLNVDRTATCSTKRGQEVCVMPHDGLDHNCYTIPEQLLTGRGSAADSISIRYANEANIPRYLARRERRWSDAEKSSCGDHDENSIPSQ